MATTSIGGNIVQIWRGEMKSPRRRLRTHERSGVNGTGVIRGAYRCPISTIFTIQTCADSRAADALEQAYVTLEGTETTAVDCNGTTHERAIVFAVESNQVRRAKIIGGASPSDTYEVHATWQFILPYTAVKKGGITQ